MHDQRNLTGNSMDDRSLAEMVLKLRTLFFFLHDLDEGYESESEDVRAVVDGFFAERFGMQPEQTAQVLRFLQAKTLVWFLFPVLSALRGQPERRLPTEPPQAWGVTIQPADASASPTVAFQLTIMRHAIAHLLDDRPGATGVDFDTWKFEARAGTVRFEDQGGFVRCLSELLDHAKHHAAGLLRQEVSGP